MHDPNRSIPALPIRMITQWAYCPRLFWLMHVEGLMEANAHVWKGRQTHKRTDKPAQRQARRVVDPDPEADGPPERWLRRTALNLGSESLGVIGTLDGVLLDEQGQAIPTELKSGHGPDDDQPPERVTQGAWAPDAIQVALQGMLLEEAGYSVPVLEIFYSASRRLCSFPLSPDLREAVPSAIQHARAVEAASQAPPPLEDSPKCAGCSLVHVCLPAETALLKRAIDLATDDDLPPDALPARPDAPPRIQRILPPHPADEAVVIGTPGAKLRREKDALVVEIPQAIAAERDLPRRQRLSLEAVREICIIGSAEVTTQALWACVEAGVHVSWLSGWGRTMASAGDLLGNNVALRVAQHTAAQRPGQALTFARAFVSGKVRNQRTFVRRNAENLPPDAKAELNYLVSQIPLANQIDTLMGLEGRAARIYFQHLNLILTSRGGDLFALDHRSRRPPRSPANALLSFGYAILINDVSHIVRRVGFDPMIGFLHQIGWGRPALALDLVEEFRPLIVDSVVTRLVSQGSLGREHFRFEPGGGVLLNAPGRQRFLAALQQRKEELITHPVFGYKLSYLRTIEVQARILARVLQGEIDTYIPFTTR